MKALKFSFLLFLSASLVFSCKEKEEDPAPADIRDQATGSYAFTLKLYKLESNGNLTYYGSQYDESGTMTVEKSGPYGLVVKQDKDTLFDCANSMAYSAGLTFDIPYKSWTDNFGFNLTRQGFPYYDVNGSMRHAYFNASEKKFYAAVKRWIVNSYDVYIYTATKL